jgi:hypothetical protein
MSDEEADMSLPNGGAAAVDVVAATQLAKIKVQNIAGVVDKSLLLLTTDTGQDDDDDDEIDDDDTIVDDTRSSVSPSLYDDELEDSAFEAIEFDNETTAGTQVCHD